MSESEKNTDWIRAITVSKVHSYYFRVSLYEFRSCNAVGDGTSLKACFKEDLEIGSWDFKMAVEIAKKLAIEKNIIYVPGISMGDSVDKVYKHIFK